MSEQTQIAWCDSTVNFWSGCTKVSDGCKHCYAEARDRRQMIEPVSHWGKGAPRLKHKGAVRDALALNRKPFICDGCNKAYAAADDRPERCECGSTDFHRRRIFSLSLGDWLDPEAPIEWLAEMLDTVRQCDQVIWILCTKRPEYFFGNEREAYPGRIEALQHHLADGPFKQWLCLWANGHPPANIILLASVENQAAANERIPALLKIPGVCHGLSMEPLLESVNLDAVWSEWNFDDRYCGIDWIIIGGESGPVARPCDVAWVRDVLVQGRSEGVPVFVKQLGSNPMMSGVAYAAAVPVGIECEHGFDVCPKCDAEPRPLYPPIKDKKGGDMGEWPEDLRVREFPVAAPRATNLADSAVRAPGKGGAKG